MKDYIMAKKFSPQEDEVLIEEIKKRKALYDFENEDYKSQYIKDSIWKEIEVVMNRSDEDCKQRWKNIRDNYMKHKRNRARLGTDSAAIRRRPPKWHLYPLLQFLDGLKHERRSLSSTSASTVSIEDFLGQDDQSQKSQTTQDEVLIKEDYDEGVGDGDVDDDDDDDFYDMTSSSSEKVPKLSDPLEFRTSSPTKTRLSNKSKLLEAMDRRCKQRLALLEQINRQTHEEDDVDLFMRSIAVIVKKLPLHLVGEAKMQILSTVTNLQLQGASQNNNL